MKKEIATYSTLSKLKRTRFIIASLVFLSCFSFAQDNQTRIELPLHNGQNEPYSVTSLGEFGLLLHAKFYSENQEVLEVMRLDTALNQVWRGFVVLDRSLDVLFTRTVNDYVYLLMKDRYNLRGEFQIVAMQVEKGTYNTFKVSTQIPFVPNSFAVTPQAALIGGYFNYRPLILRYEWGQQGSRVLPGFWNDPGELDQITTDENGNVDIVVSSKSQQNRKCLWLRSYDSNGELVKTILIQPDEDKHLLFGRTIQTSDGQQFVCGVYGRFTEYSRGLFIANINEYGEYTIKYYNFGDLEHFFKYMKERREARVKERIERRKIKGKKLRFNYRLMVSDLIPYKDQYIMLGEAFYPHYSYPSYSRGGINSYTFSRYGVTGTRGDLVFDGYQYTHAFIAGFDKSGNLIWDNSFEINDVRSFQLEQYVKIVPRKDRIGLMYLFDHRIRTKTIRDSQVLEGKSTDPLKTQFQGDVIKDRDTEKSKLEFWYGNNFYATGIQRVTNRRDASAIQTRRVFFINKIVFND